MKKTLLYLNIIFVILIMFGGCAGGKHIKQNSEPKENNLPLTISESLSFRITNEHSREVIMGINPDRLSPSKHLEVKLLQQLAGSRKPGDINNAFDRVWEQDDKLRKIVQQNDPPAAFIPSLALVYFMLTCDDTYDWRDRTGRNLYRKTLQYIQPTQLSGYSLHFYTMALLNNGNFDSVLSCLNCLEQKTPPPIYLQNLIIALRYAAEKENLSFAEKIIKHMKTFSRQNNLKPPDDQIAALLNGLKASAAAEPETVEIRLRDDTVRIRMQVIEADNTAAYVDPALGKVGVQLNNALQTTQVSLKKTDTFLLVPGQNIQMTVDNRHEITVLLKSVSVDNARIKVTVFKGKEDVYHTVIETKDKGEAIISGPEIKDKKLLLRITTWLDV